jgi:hypothetical protein
LLDNVFQAVGGSWCKCWVWAEIDAIVTRCALQAGVDLEGYVRDWRQLKAWAWCLEPTFQRLQGK